MEQSNHIVDKYYIKKVDADRKSIYCYHDVMGELLIPTHKHDKAQMLYAEGDVVFVTTETKPTFYRQDTLFGFLVEWSIVLNQNQKV